MRIERDTDYNGKVDEWQYYEGGKLDRIGYDTTGTGRSIAGTARPRVSPQAAASSPAGGAAARDDAAGSRRDAASGRRRLRRPPRRPPATQTAKK